MTDSKIIKELEQVGAASWLAREIEFFGGWQLRANDGVTRRANSVLPIESPECSLEKSIEYVVDFYKSKNIIPRFQMTEISLPLELDDVLVDSGWDYGLEVAIEVADVEKVLENRTDVRIEFQSHPSEEWMNAYILGSEHKDKDPSVRPALMTRSPMKKVFASSIIDDEIASVGLGILNGDWIGLYSIATHPEYRRQKAGVSVSQALVSWGKDNHANRSYLQVETDNIPAKRMYSQLGFKNCYTYWYRYYDVEKE
ncbi:MAG: GNAT family N-acetyltransferase [Candidatus Thorarchaeota archaeon]|nr:GNAT family N-acetyltransferase [Candidatus Thorarchaeota archaeon]